MATTKKSTLQSVSPKATTYASRNRLIRQKQIHRAPENDSAAQSLVFPGNGHRDQAGYAEQLLAALLAVKKGDFNVRLPVGWVGIGGKVADTFNDVAELMARSTDELSRVSRVVGKE